MTPIRAINYATWAIWSAVTAIALLNAGWVRITTIEAGGAFPMTVEFFAIPDCYWRSYLGSHLGEWRNFLEMYMLPTNLILIGFAIAVRWSRLRTATAALSLLTIYLTFAFASEPRIYCIPPVDLPAYLNIHGPSDISHLVGITLFDVVSLVPRVLFLALFLVTPVKWEPVGSWIRNVLNRRVRATLTP